MATTATASVGSQTHDTVYMLFKACCHDDRAQVERLLSLKKSEEDKTAFVNRKHTELGHTPLHEACCHGSKNCIQVLLKHKADGLTYDGSGLSPIHTAAYYNQREAIELLLIHRACEVNSTGRDGETALHMACLGGHLEIVRYLLEWGDVDVDVCDTQGSSVLHYAAASDRQELVIWILDSRPQLREKISSVNERGHTPYHLACILGCPHSLSTLLQHDVTHTPHNSHTLSHSQHAEILGNDCCHGIAMGTRKPLQLSNHTLPAREDSQISDPLHHSNSSGYFDQHPVLSRQTSIVGQSRPVNLSLRRQSLRTQSSWEEGKEGRREEGRERRKGKGGGHIYLSSRDSATRLSQTLEREKSRSVEQLLYDNTAYEPPPDIIFNHPQERPALTPSQTKYSSLHDITLTVPRYNWGPNLAPQLPNPLPICLSVAMHCNQILPPGVSIVSPICFLSARSPKSIRIHLSLPHAVYIPQDEDISRFFVLTASTTKLTENPESPIFNSRERNFTPLEGAKFLFEGQWISFETELSRPSLFAVGVRDGLRTIPLPLRCLLYIVHPESGREATITGVEMEAYVGMELGTVTTMVQKWAKDRNYRLEMRRFIMRGEEVKVRGTLTNQIEDWKIECKGDGRFPYSQVVLTHHTDRSTYSHRLAYPPCERFFIEPKRASSAVKCKLTVADTIADLCALLVVPYTPQRAPTSERSYLTPMPSMEPNDNDQFRNQMHLRSLSPSPPPPRHPSLSPPPSSSSHSSPPRSSSRSPLLYSRSRSPPPSFRALPFSRSPPPPPSSSRPLAHRSPPSSSSASPYHRSPILLRVPQPSPTLSQSQL